MYIDRELNNFIFSPSDLTNYMISPFSSWMDRYAILNPDVIEDNDSESDPMLDLLAKKGSAHENDFLSQVKEKYGGENVAVLKSKDKNHAKVETIDAMEAGYQVIFQAYLERDGFAGYADFLFKVEGLSELGNYHYEVWDTKLSSAVKPYFLIQLCCYSWMLEEKQERLPEEIAIIPGNSTFERFRLASLYNYFHMLKKQFILANAEFVNDIGAQPNPELYSNLGKWDAYGKRLMIERDSLAFVANIRKSQIRKLHVSGITTLTQLAKTRESNVKGIGVQTFNKLRDQASIQSQSKNLEVPAFKVLKSDNNKGLSMLPPKSVLDIFFDIEGHPLMGGGLEYLWGVSHYRNNDDQVIMGKDYPFKDWWAHSHEQEKVAFEGFVDWAYARWLKDPLMHIYHYASYEVTAMRKLSNKYNTRLEKVADLLKNGVMIDLYVIVKNGLLIGEPRYSIKNVEHLYRGKRETEVATGGDSIVFYENWRASGGVEAWCKELAGYEKWLADPEHFDWLEWPDLNSIRDYNIDDCESTLELVEWLRDVQQKHDVAFEYAETSDEDNQQLTWQQEARTALRERQQILLNTFNESEDLKQDPIAKQLADLIGFHHREANVGTWAYFDRLEKSDEELYDDATALVGVTLTRVSEGDGKVLYKGVFDGQQAVRTDKFKSGIIANSEVKAKEIQFLDSKDKKSGQIQFNISLADVNQNFNYPITLLAVDGVINTQTLEQRNCDIAEEYFNRQKISPLLKTILNRAPPGYEGRDYLPVTRSIYQDDYLYNQAMVDAVKNLNQSCLCIQGPPGSGKTFSATNIIKALVETGKRVGVMSNSHSAIMNLLAAVCQALPDYQIAKVGPSNKSKLEFEENYPLDIYPNLYFRKDMKFPKTLMPYTACSVVGATAFGFANKISIDHPMDYLFIDEASQVALANLVAISASAKNIILMGDQMQLEQPIQGAHPGDSGKSALDFMLGEHAVIPADQGIFLERTYRMHPDVCKPLSDIVYEGKLGAAPQNDQIKLEIPAPKLITSNTGILSVPVHHEGNLQSSEEEVSMVEILINEIITGSFTNNNGETRKMTKEDILVVAPYNMQVNLLKNKLGNEIKIGTIDKFQGQQAPVVIVSIGTSDVNESARGLDFVFDINRLNVAISRAQALAIVVSKEGLHLCDVTNFRQIEKVNFFCRLLGIN